AARVCSMAMAGRLLGRHVSDGAEDSAVGSRGRGGILKLPIQSRQPKVEHVRIALAINKDVGGFQVAMVDALPVGMVDGLGDPGDQVGPLGRPARMTLTPGPEIDAIDVLGYQVVWGAMAAVIVQLDNPRVPQTRDCAGLALKALHCVRLVQLFGM